MPPNFFNSLLLICQFELKRLFSTRYKLKVVGIDFDVSANRYLDPKIIKEKEALETKYALWALKDYDNFIQLHNLYLNKLEYLNLELISLIKILSVL